MIVPKYTVRRGESNEELCHNGILTDVTYARDLATAVSQRIGEPVNLFLVTETLVETIGTWADKKRETAGSKCSGG